MYEFLGLYDDIFLFFISVYPQTPMGVLQKFCKVFKYTVYNSCKFSYSNDIWKTFEMLILKLPVRFSTKTTTKYLGILL